MHATVQSELTYENRLSGVRWSAHRVLHCRPNCRQPLAPAPLRATVWAVRLHLLVTLVGSSTIEVSRSCDGPDRQRSSPGTANCSQLVTRSYPNEPQRGLGHRRAGC